MELVHLVLEYGSYIAAIVSAAVAIIMVRTKK